MKSIPSWNIMRIARLGLGVFGIIQAIATRDILLGLMGITITGMAIYNVGCCGSAGCETSSKPIKNNKGAGDVDFTEIR